ncbi:MAG: cache domain-containing protein [Magnetospirillum gryphiswaldense]|nr:cache domain-containing protein [Magnetospirillum gryphiswaldense]
MKLVKTAMIAGAMLLAQFGVAQADECATAQTLVDKAIGHYAAVGKEKSFADFMNKDNKEWVDGELYVIVSTMDGIFKVHAINPKLIDNDKLPALKDTNGVMIIQEMIRVGKETPAGGWAKYTWTHPETKKLAPKQTWVKVKDNQLFMVGCYP